jgi:hypothetical protein
VGPGEEELHGHAHGRSKPPVHRAVSGRPQHVRPCRKCDSFSPSQNKGVDFDLGTATQTSLTFTGRNKVLKFWAAGDEVATNSWASLGNPPGVSLFRSSVSGWPAGFFTNEDGIGLDDTTCNSFGCTFGSSYAKAPIVAS